MKITPVQNSFIGGETSTRTHGQIDSPLYRHSLKECKNFIVEPQGPIRMRPGTRYLGTYADIERLLPFPLAGREPACIALDNLGLRVFETNGAVQPLKNQLLSNGQFHSGVIREQPLAGDGVDGWWDSFPTPNEQVSPLWNPGGFMRIKSQWFGQAENLQAGQAYTLYFRARSPDGGTLDVVIDERGGLNRAVASLAQVLTATWQTYVFPFVGVFNNICDFSFMENAGKTVDVDDIVLIDDALPDSAAITPWHSAEIPDVMCDYDSSRNIMLLVHPAGIRTLSLSAQNFFLMRAPPWVNKPADWEDGNYPAAVEWGYQGRLWLAGEPDQSNVFRGSKSGSPFDFTVDSPPTDASAMSWTASVRGAIRWLRGQLSLLLGAEQAEQAANRNGALVSAKAPPDIRDESGFGSARIQPVVAGDEVIFVDKTRNALYAFSFDAQTKDGWVAQALSLIAEHLVRDVKEVHFAKSPDPTLLVVSGDGRLVGCTRLKRADGAQVLAWWQVNTGTVATAAVLERTAGSEVWLAVDRANGRCLEVLQLYEAGANFVDSAVSGVVAADGTFAGLAHLEGETVRVIVNGALESDQVVVGGAIQAVSAERIAEEPALVGAPITVGLPFLARAKTLPPPEHLLGRARSARATLLLNDSALPLVNGDRAEPDRDPATPQNTPSPRVTKRVRTVTLGYDEDGAITIEQDLPFRTEILGIVSTGSANDLT